MRPARAAAGGHAVKGVSLVAAVLALSLSLAACEREQRRFVDVAASRGPDRSAVSALQAGGPRPRPSSSGNPYADNAWAVSEGKRLYSWFNCVGCHAHGGGGIGPPLMDDKWIYGGEPANLCEHRRGAAERDAGLRQPRTSPAGLADRRLRAIDERRLAQGCPPRSRSPHDDGTVTRSAGCAKTQNGRRGAGYCERDRRDRMNVPLRPAKSSMADVPFCAGNAE